MVYTINKKDKECLIMNKSSKFVGHTLKICISLLLVALLSIGCARGETQSDIPDCVISNSSNDDYSLTIIANREEIEDKEAFAKELIEQVRNNGFKTIMFSFEETGYPTSLDMTVYLNENDWKSRNDPFMKVTFRQENAVDGYNIVEDYDKFQLQVK